MFRFIVLILLSFTVLVLISCSDFSGQIGKSEIVSPQNGFFVDTVLSAVKDSSYRRPENNMSYGYLYFGYYHGMEGSTFLRFDSFGSLDSLWMDSVQVDSTTWRLRYDSVRVESATLVLHGLRESYGLLADHTPAPIQLNFFTVDTLVSQSTASFDIMNRHQLPLNVTVTLPMDTTNVDSVVIPLPFSLIPLIQSWVTIRTNLNLVDTNMGIWLRPDTLTAQGLRAFNAAENLDTLRPELRITYSKMLNGIPIGAVPDTVNSQPYDDISFIHVDSTRAAGLNCLQLGSGDDVRAVIWFDIGSLIRKQVNVHHATLVLTRSDTTTDFGSFVALESATSYNDSTQWSSEPSYWSNLPRVFPLDGNTVRIDVSDIVSHWVSIQKQTGVILLYDSWESNIVSRTHFGSVYAGNPAHIEITLSQLQRGR